MKTIALIVAGGKSKRFGGEVPKQYREISGKPLLTWTISKFEEARMIDRIVVVVPEEYLLFTSEQVVDPYNFRKVIKIVIGGETRRESVYKGLESLPISTNYVAIHDGARLLVSPNDIDRVVEIAKNEKAAILAEKVTDTVKRAKDNYILTTLEREQLFLAQTPQVFQYDLIIEAHRKVNEKNNHCIYTDDASLIEARGFKVMIVESTSPNIKVTSKSDLLLAKVLMDGCNNG